MNKIVLYTTNCAKCAVLETKLKEKNIQYETVEDIQEMISLGLVSAPNLKVGEQILEFSKAVKWINEYSGE